MKLREDLNTLKGINKIIVFADKSNNKYCVSKSDYNDEIRNNITSKYRRADENMVKEANLKSAQIAKEIELDDKMEGIIPSNCFLTVKDTKPNFPSEVSCCVIVPSTCFAPPRWSSLVWHSLGGSSLLGYCTAGIPLSPLLYFPGPQVPHWPGGRPDL